MTDALIPSELPEQYLPEPHKAPGKRVVPCRIAGQLYGVPVARAGEMVVLNHGIVPVALAPDCVRGVLNRQGRMATVVEARLAMGADPAPAPSLIGLTVEHKGHLYVLAVDEVREIMALDAAREPIAPLDVGAIVASR